MPSQSRELQEDQGRLTQRRPRESGGNMGSVVHTVAEREFLGQVTSAFSVSHAPGFLYTSQAPRKPGPTKANLPWGGARDATDCHTPS